MDEFAQIQAFIRVVETGSFSAAARQGSSISSVARQVKSLEERLGVRLLNRSTRSLSLTEPGKVFYERVSDIVRRLSDAREETKSFETGVKGVLRVSLRVTTGTTIIVPALPAFLARFPDLSVDISLTDERLDLVANNIDVAVWMGSLPDSDLVARRLCASQRIVCGSPAYFQRRQVPRKPADLRHHNCILFAARSYGNVWGFTKGQHHEEVEVHGNLRSSNGLVLLSAALADVGVVVVHEWMVRAHIAQGHLLRVLDDYTVNPTTAEADLFAVYRGRVGLPRKVRAFVDFLAELFDEPTADDDASKSLAVHVVK